jgi:threonine aldolase
MQANRIDLYSDTQSRPTDAMRKAMAEAPVGDEQRGEDPSVNQLCAMTAELLGKEAAVFLPSGTMCNEIAILLHCRPGDEIIADQTAHIINSEAGGPAAFAGAMLRPLAGERGIYTADQAEAALRDKGRHTPNSRMIEVEQTSNFGGGTVWPLAAIEAVAEVAKCHDLALHMDGARLLNAVVASGVAARDYAAPFDSLWIDLSKGLGCPVGAVLAGSSPFIDQAWQWKHRMGGAMRQAGIIAAAGVHALEHHVDRLAEDNGNARHFADLIAEVPGITIDPETVETNIVFFDVAEAEQSAPQIAEGLAGHGVRIGPMGENTMRAVTHIDVDRAMIEEAAGALRAVVTGA